MSALLWEFGGEPAEDGFDVSGEEIEGGESNYVAGVAEAYAQGKFTVHAHVRVRSRTGQSDYQELCFLVSRKRVEVLADDVTRVFVREEDKAFGSMGVNSKQRWVDKSMLVEVGKTLESSENVYLVRQGLSTVRLRSVDDCFMTVGDAVQSSFAGARFSLFPDTPVVPSARANRELAGGTAGLAGIQQDELTDKMVQGRSKVVEHVAEDGPPVGKVSHRLDDLPCEDILAAVGIELMRDRVGFGFAREIATHCRLDGLQVFYATSMFRPTAF
jgi:hypothetical protein